MHAFEVSSFPVARKKLQKRKKLMDSFQDMDDEDANSSLDTPGFEDISH